MNEKHESIFRFVNALKQFKSDKMEIAFNAERSVQDAIVELSESESTTVFISYTVMFIYVAVALGSFRTFYTFLVCVRLHAAVKPLNMDFIVWFVAGLFKIHISIRRHCHCHCVGDV